MRWGSGVVGVGGIGVSHGDSKTSQLTHLLRLTDGLSGLKDGLLQQILHAVEVVVGRRRRYQRRQTLARQREVDHGPRQARRCNGLAASSVASVGRGAVGNG